MNIVKLGLISIIVFGIMLLGFTAIMPSHVRISRAADIHASTDRIERALVDMKASNKSFTYKWNVISFDTVSTVQLYYDFHLKWYPWQKLGSIIYDKQLGPVMEKWLVELKKEVEN